MHQPILLCMEVLYSLGTHQSDHAKRSIKGLVNVITKEESHRMTATKFQEFGHTHLCFGMITKAFRDLLA